MHLSQAIPVASCLRQSVPFLPHAKVCSAGHAPRRNNTRTTVESRKRQQKPSESQKNRQNSAEKRQRGQNCSGEERQQHFPHSFADITAGRFSAKFSNKTSSNAGKWLQTYLFLTFKPSSSAGSDSSNIDVQLETQVQRLEQLCVAQPSQPINHLQVFRFSLNGIIFL